MRNLTEHELSVAIPILNRRIKAFIEHGLNKKDASDLADRMFERDHSIDDRRVCFECVNLDLQDKTCKVMAEKPMIFQLQRCNKFKIKGKS
jgi:hypothetical protein